jgi:hypothetical protein
MANSASHSVDTGDSFTGVQQPEREVDHSSLSSVEVKNDRAVLVPSCHGQGHIYFWVVGVPVQDQALRYEGDRQTGIRWMRLIVHKQLLSVAPADVRCCRRAEWQVQ